MNTLDALKATQVQPSLKELRMQAPQPSASSVKALEGTPPALYAPFKLDAPNVQSPTFGNKLNVFA